MSNTHSHTQPPFVWPLSQSTVPDEMNTSYGPRIDADRWDFHDGIDVPAPVGTPVHAMADGRVHRAGPADKTAPGHGFGSTHVVLKVLDPKDGQDDLYLVYLHLDGIAEGVIAGAEVKQGDVLGTVGEEDATYPHLHFEFRKLEPREPNSQHPLHHLPYHNKMNVGGLGLDRCNFSADGRRAVRIRFDIADRREGDVQGVALQLTGDTVECRDLLVDFDDRETIVSDKGDSHAFNAEGVAIEGYQKSNMKGVGLNKLHYGVLVKDIAPGYDCAKLQILDARGGRSAVTEFGLPTLQNNENPVHVVADFEEPQFPPTGWELRVQPGNTCRPDESAAASGQGPGRKGLLCKDVPESYESLIRAGIRYALPVERLPVRPMSWRLRATVRPVEVSMDEGLDIYPLAFLVGNDIVAAACLQKLEKDRLASGVLIRGKDGTFRKRIDVQQGRIEPRTEHLWQLELLRIGTRQTTAVVWLDHQPVVRINGDTTSVEPDYACAGVLHEHSGLSVALHLDQLRLTESL
jgi:murein DD-endopeptidase MepM/ murein hydrolase activator NlpD